MKVILVAAFLLLTSGFIKAQKVFSVDYSNQADVKVFVVKYENQADLCVYKVEYSNQAEDNDGKWFFTDYENQSDKTIYFVNYENQADLNIFFVEYEDQAGWKSTCHWRAFSDSITRDHYYHPYTPPSFTSSVEMCKWCHFPVLSTE
jgi:hypothetical protein